jgi:hypothetical protein
MSESLVETGFHGFMRPTSGFQPPVHLTIGQWAALVLAPMLVFATCIWLLCRYERRLAAGTLLT